MARPWNNPRLQRTVMQVALCAALAITIAVAWWVVQFHARALAVTLDAPRQFRSESASLVVRLPVGWRVHLDEDGELRAVETQPRYGLPRTMIVAVEPTKKGPGKVPHTIEKEVSDRMKGRVPVGAAQPLQVLGQPALVYKFPAYPIGPQTALSPEFVVCAIVGEKDHPKTVFIEVMGIATLAPADADLVKLVAGSLAWPDPSHPAPPLISSIDSPSEHDVR